MKTCNCGAQCADDAKNCPQCGAALNPTPVQNVMGQMNTNSLSAKKNLNIIGLVAGALLIICAFLPYVSVSLFGIDVNMTLLADSKGVLFMILGVLAIIFTVLGKDKGLLIVGIIACVLAIVEVSDIADLTGEGYGDVVTKGIGFYAMIVASLAAVAAMPVWKILSKKTNA